MTVQIKKECVYVISKEMNDLLDSFFGSEELQDINYLINVIDNDLNLSSEDRAIALELLSVIES